MAFNPLGYIAGNAADLLGTTLGWSDLGISEALAGGNTVNTGTKPITNINPDTSGVRGYYVKDGNRYVMDGAGITNVGTYTSGNDSYWDNLGYTNLGSPSTSGNAGTENDMVMGYSRYTGSGSSAPAYSQDDIDYLDWQRSKLEGQRGGIDKTQADGLWNIENEYNKSSGRYNEDKTNAMNRLADTRQGTQKQQTNALGRIDTNAMTLADSLRRRLGMASGANSSAYRFAAPNAVARQAGQQRTGVMEDYATNWKNIDRSENDTKTQFERLLEDLNTQRSDSKKNFEASILGKRNQIDSSLSDIASKRNSVLGGTFKNARSAMAPYESSISARDAEIQSLFDKYKTPYTMKEAQVYNPDLKQYMVDRTAINANSQNGNSDYAPYYRKPQDEEEKLY